MKVLLAFQWNSVQGHFKLYLELLLSLHQWWKIFLLRYFSSLILFTKYCLSSLFPDVPCKFFTYIVVPLIFVLGLLLSLEVLSISILIQRHIFIYYLYIDHPQNSSWATGEHLLSPSRFIQMSHTYLSPGCQKINLSFHSNWVFFFCVCVSLLFSVHSTQIRSQGWSGVFLTHFLYSANKSCWFYLQTITWVTNLSSFNILTVASLI